MRPVTKPSLRIRFWSLRAPRASARRSFWHCSQSPLSWHKSLLLLMLDSLRSRRLLLSRRAAVSTSLVSSNQSRNAASVCCGVWDSLYFLTAATISAVLSVPSRLSRGIGLLCSSRSSSSITRLAWATGFFEVRAADATDAFCSAAGTVVGGQDAGALWATAPSVPNMPSNPQTTADTVRPRRKQRIRIQDYFQSMVLLILARRSTPAR